jgi:hypothetical protein
MITIINILHKYVLLSSVSIYFYSRVFDKNLIYDWYKPSFILWVSLTNLYLFELLRKDIKKGYQ